MRLVKGVLVGGALLLVGSFDAEARPGGGSSYSGRSGGGGGGSYSGGGGGGGSYSGDGGSGWDWGVGGDGFAIIMVGGLAILGAFAAVTSALWDSSQPAWDSTTFPVDMPIGPPPHVDVGPLQRRDPNFSLVLLEDFLFELYARAHRARSDRRELATLAPYASAHARGILASRGGREPVCVDGVVIGAMNLIRFEEADRLYVEFEANYTETIAREGQEHRLGFYVVERWTLKRARTAVSPPPAKTLAFNCPSCGAPVEYDETETCTHCGETNTFGAHAWLCSHVKVRTEETRPPTLTAYAPEVFGPEREASPGTSAAFDQLMAKHHGGNAGVFFQRVGEVYAGLNRAWSLLRWDDARPLLSDRLWLSWRYWVEAYAAQNLRNEMRDAVIERTQIAEVDGDPFFDVVVVRIFAQAIDVTLHVESNLPLAGDATRPRKYSEYWTFIRPTGRDGSDEEGACPNCGAPLEIEMAGRCKACRVKVTQGGNFDWVLSKVEQDEAYRPA
ncbi:MAG: TIM44-like domain-containing protein [Myxococcota bacterium]